MKPSFPSIATIQEKRTRFFPNLSRLGIHHAHPSVLTVDTCPFLFQESLTCSSLSSLLSPHAKISRGLARLRGLIQGAILTYEPHLASLARKLHPKASPLAPVTTRLLQPIPSANLVHAHLPDLRLGVQHCYFHAGLPARSHPLTMADPDRCAHSVPSSHGRGSGVELSKRMPAPGYIAC